MGEGDKNDEKRSTGHITVYKLKVVSVNARSIMNKLDELQCIAVEENPDIICITETWAHKDITYAGLNQEGYNLVQNDREDMKGGGCIIYIRGNLHYVICEELTKTPNTETVWCRVTTMTGSLLVEVCYHSTSADLEK